MQQGIHCLNDGPDIRFGTSAAYARPARFLGQLFRQMNRDHEDRNLGKKFRDLTGHVKAVEIWHLKVEQNHIGRILFHPLQGFSSRSGLIAHLPGTLLLEESTKIVADRRIVIHN